MVDCCVPCKKKGDLHTHTHPLDKVAPCQVLLCCFRIFGRFSQWSGILPVSFDWKTGLIEFKLLSWPIIPYLIYICGVFGTSGLYLPTYLSQSQSNLSTQEGGDVASIISDNLFIGGQLFGVAVTLLLIPFISRDLVKVWGQMVSVAVFIIDHGHGGVFKKTYFRCRIFLPIYIIMMNVYGIICWRDFTSREGSLDSIYLPDSLNWLHIIGLIGFFGMCFYHICHCVILQFYVFSIATMFRGLRKCTKTFLQHQDSQESKGSLKDLREIVRTYEEICLVCKGLGRAYGVYILVELVVMMTSVLMNVFQILSKFEQRDPWTTAMSLVGYVWFMIVISHSGELLTRQGKVCFEKIQDAVEGNKIALEDLAFRHRLGRLRSPKISAAGYFNVNRRLAVTMGSTFATYFVVIIQFKMNAMSRGCGCNKP